MEFGILIIAVVLLSHWSKSKYSQIPPAKPKPRNNRDRRGGMGKSLVRALAAGGAFTLFSLIYSFEQSLLRKYNCHPLPSMSVIPAAFGPFSIFG